MNPMEVHYKNSFAALKIGHYLAEHLDKNSAIVCIGTDKCIIDSLGPLIGTMLTKENLAIDIYGTLDKPVHAINLAEYIQIIKSKNYGSVLAIDACLSTKKNQGIVEVRKGPITPGKGIGKFLPDIGDLSIIGIVDSSDKNFQNLVQDTRLSFIYEMSQVITEGILTAMNIIEIMDEGYLIEDVSISST